MLQVVTKNNQLTWIMKSLSSSTSQIHRTISSLVSTAPESTLRGGVVTSKSTPKSSSLHPQLSVDQSLMLSSSTVTGTNRTIDLSWEWHDRNELFLVQFSLINILYIYKMCCTMWVFMIICGLHDEASHSSKEQLRIQSTKRLTNLVSSVTADSLIL